MASGGTATAGVSRFRSLVGGSIGNLVEWYDFYAYSALSLYFAHVFFPKGDPTAQLLNAAAVFAIGFLMRPVGGWWLGIYADRHGRKAALSLSVMLMASGSAIVAVCPGYASIGVAAPAILVLARLLQGLSVGGEYGASATYMSEIAGKRHRGFAASFQYVTLIGGQLLALGVVVLLQQWLSDAELSDWGWRFLSRSGRWVRWLRCGCAVASPRPRLSRRCRSMPGATCSSGYGCIAAPRCW